MESEQNKKIALEFLEHIVTGDNDHAYEAYEKYVDMEGKHHNAHTVAGFAALREGMIGSNETFPNKTFTIKHVLGDQDMVAVHSHLVLQERELELSAVHMFRFHNGKIVEMWDIGQAVSPDSPNEDGMF